MGGKRTHRLLLLALTVALAAVLAIPASLSPPPDRTRISLDGGPSPFVAHPATPLPVVVPAPPPPPRLEHAIQPPTDLAVSGDPSAGSVGAAAYRDRAPIVRAPTTEAAKNVFGLIIGINDYPGTTSDLQGAVPDAEDMSDVLALYGVPVTNVRTL